MLLTPENQVLKYKKLGIELFMVIHVIFKRDLHLMFRMGVFLILMLFANLILLMHCLYCELQNLLYLHICPVLHVRANLDINTIKIN